MEKQVVHVNGKAYDAVTGRRIDGIVPPPKKPAGKTGHGNQASKPKARQSSLDSRDINHTQAHQPQHAQTLMRHAVKKPAPGLKKQLHPTHALAHQQPQAITVKHAVYSVDKARLHRANQVEKSHHVSRYHGGNEVKPVFTTMPFQAAPQDMPGAEPPAAPPPLPTNKPDDMFEKAIENANHYIDIAARKTHLKKKTRRHAFSMAAGTLALLFIAGFAAYQNTPGLQIKVAGIRAGVATATPNFQATGFAYDGARAQDSKLVIGLSGGNHQYQLTEQATNLSSEDMIKHVSATDASGTPNYEVVEAGASTVYRLGEGQATWVKDGIWYQIHGDQGLSDDQLKNLAQNT
ncbi:hypothetical protein KDA14_00725 [Candidatus Saccharibacteria bacterium]|nr:hypothetical protein [Candidatus Saccharibacteria bacterium]